MSEFTESKKLEAASFQRDLRRDLRLYTEYALERGVKRTYRENTIPKGDLAKLARLMGETKEMAKALEHHGWIPYLDRLALRLGFVSYKMPEQRYGYYYSDRHYQDNFIEVNLQQYEQFLALPLAQQEKKLLDALINDGDYNRNEFYTPAMWGRLDSFPTWGSAVGVVPTLNFAAIRRFLLDILQRHPSGTWYSTASLIQELKTHHRYFLIPEKPVLKGRHESGRYANFYEGLDYYVGSRSPISPDLPDAFERVEGRYVERFLENIPFILGYVDVAYGIPADPVKPALGMLQAFRLQERFLQVMQDRVPEPRVIVQPNFEIYIESPFYPAQLLRQLTPLTEVVSEGTTTILKLQRQKVAAAVAYQPNLEVVALLKSLAAREIPQNIVIELEEWAGHAEAFTLYSGFALVEGTAKIADTHHVETIAPHLQVVRDAKQVLTDLRRAEQIPLHIQHPAEAFQTLPKNTKTVFPRDSAVKREKVEVTLRREVRMTVYFPDLTLLESMRKAMLDARCLVDIDLVKRSLTFPKRHEAQFKEVIKSFQEITGFSSRM